VYTREVLLDPKSGCPYTLMVCTIFNKQSLYDLQLKRL
jgi:hypothetical protein